MEVDYQSLTHSVIQEESCWQAATPIDVVSHLSSGFGSRWKDPSPMTTPLPSSSYVCVTWHEV